MIEGSGIDFRNLIDQFRTAYLEAINDITVVHAEHVINSRLAEGSHRFLHHSSRRTETAVENKVSMLLS